MRNVLTEFAPRSTCQWGDSGGPDDSTSGPDFSGAMSFDTTGFLGGPETSGPSTGGPDSTGPDSTGPSGDSGGPSGPSGDTGGPGGPGDLGPSPGDLGPGDLGPGGLGPGYDTTGPSGTGAGYGPGGGGPFGTGGPGGGGPFGEQGGPQQSSPFGEFQGSQTQGPQSNISVPTTDPSNPLSGLDPLGQIYSQEFGPNSLAGQLGIQDIGKGINQQITAPTNINPDLAVQLGIQDIGRNTENPLAIDPTVQPGERGTLGPAQPAPAYQGRSGMDFEFNPFSNVAPQQQQNQGTQGFQSLLDMLGPNPAQARDVQDVFSRSIDVPVNPELLSPDPMGPQQTFGPNVNAPPAAAPFAPSPGSPGHFQDAFGNFPTQTSNVGKTTADTNPNLNDPNTFNPATYAPSPGPNPNLVDPATFDPNTYAPSRGPEAPGPAPGWDPSQQQQGVNPSNPFANAPNSLNEALQAAQRGDPNVLTAPFAQMPWGTTFAPPGLPAPDFQNQLFQTQMYSPAPSPWNDQPGKSLDELRAEHGREIDPLLSPQPLGPPQSFSRETQNIPVPAPNPLNPFERGNVMPDRPGPERGVMPQDRDARDLITRSVERAVERSQTPLQITVPGRPAPAPAPSRSTTAPAPGTRGPSGAPNVSRGQLDALLNQARTAPTLSGRISALDQLNGIISAMKDAGIPNPYGRDPDTNIAAALRQGR